MAELAMEFAVAAQVMLLKTQADEARRRAEEAIASGQAVETFRRMVEAQGGDPRVVDDPTGVLPRAPVTVPLEPDRSGYLSAVDAEAIGRTAVALGAGRRRKGDPIDPAVGVVIRAKVGDRVQAGDPIGEVHARDEKFATASVGAVNAALTITDSRAEAPPLVYRWRDV
jgi:pyrimidine-nucleoside phosphorylase